MFSDFQRRHFCDLEFYTLLLFSWKASNGLPKVRAAQRHFASNDIYNIPYIITNILYNTSHTELIEYTTKQKWASFKCMYKLGGLQV